MERTYFVRKYAVFGVGAIVLTGNLFALYAWKNPAIKGVLPLVQLGVAFVFAVLLFLVKGKEVLQRKKCSVIPLIVPVFGLCGATTSFYMRGHYDLPWQQGTPLLLVAPLEGDLFDTHSTILRDSLAREVSKVSDVRVRRLPRRTSEHQEKNLLFTTDQRIAGVLQGNERWLQLYLPPLPSKNLDKLRGGRPLVRPSSKSFIMIRSIPSIGLSMDKGGITVTFLSAVSAGLAHDYSDDAIHNFQRATQLYGLWSTNAHRAYPFWKLGNISLETYLHSMERGELLCAIEQYTAALKSMLRPADNLPLNLAIRNNLAIAKLLLSEKDGNADVKKQTFKLLKGAQGLIKAQGKDYLRGEPDMVLLRNYSHFIAQLKRS